MKHGLTGAGVCLPESLEQELVAEYNALAAEVKPQTLLERRFVEQAAIGSMRFMHAQAQIRALTGRRTRRALRTWDKKRERRVDAALRRLATDPAGALGRLVEMAEGCDALHDEWDALRQVLESQGRWDSTQTERALRLVGEAALPTIASATLAAELWLAAMATREAPDPRLLAHFFGDPAAAADRLPTADEARSSLLAFAAAEMVRWAAEGDRLWQTRDEAERRSAVDESLLDLGPEFARLEGYQRGGAGLMSRSLRALTAHRKEMARIDKAGGLPPPQVVTAPPGPPRENEAIWTPPMPGAMKPQVIPEETLAASPADESHGIPSAPDRPRTDPGDAPSPAGGTPEGGVGPDCP